MRERFIPCFLSPSDDATLCEGEKAEEADRHRREDRRPRRRPGPFPAGRCPGGSGGPRPESEPTHSPKTAPIDGDRDGDLGAAEEVGQRRGRLDPPEDLAARGVERAHHLGRLGIDRAQAVERVDGDREEADQGDDRQLGADPEAEPDDQDRRDDDDRDRLRGDDQRVEGAAQRLGEVQGDGEGKPATSAQPKPSSISCSVTQAFSAEQRAALPERFGDFGRGGDEEAFEVEQVGEGARARGDLPGADQTRRGAAVGRSQRFTWRPPAGRASPARGRRRTRGR